MKIPAKDLAVDLYTVTVTGHEVAPSQTTQTPVVLKRSFAQCLNMARGSDTLIQAKPPNLRTVGSVLARAWYHSTHPSSVFVPIYKNYPLLQSCRYSPRNGLPALEFFEAMRSSSDEVILASSVFLQLLVVLFLTRPSSFLLELFAWVSPDGCFFSVLAT